MEKSNDEREGMAALLSLRSCDKNGTPKSSSAGNARPAPGKSLVVAGKQENLQTLLEPMEDSNTEKPSEKDEANSGVLERGCERVERQTQLDTTNDISTESDGNKSQMPSTNDGDRMSLSSDEEDEAVKAIMNLRNNWDGMSTTSVAAHNTNGEKLQGKMGPWLG